MVKTQRSPMNPEPVNVIREEWDYLIILDACRYDYFERFWKNYFTDGQLSHRWSPGSCTQEWRDRALPEKYDDIVYISANPHFSIKQKGTAYQAGDHFFKVVEVWKSHWDTEIGTVRPEALTDAAIAIIHDQSLRNKRIIIHYLQPHAPYLASGIDSKGHSVADIKQRSGSIETYPNGGMLKVKAFLAKMFVGIFKHMAIFGNKPDWTIRKLLNLPPRTPMEYFLRKHGTPELRNAYEQNLKAVFAEVARLLQYLSGTIVITSDHGEFLGENKNFSHPKNSSHPTLRDIPWLVIQKSDGQLLYDKPSASESPSGSDSDLSEEAVIERLRALGYHD